MIDQEYLIGIGAFLAGLMFLAGYVVGAVIVMWYNHQTIHESPIYFR